MQKSSPTPLRRSSPSSVRGRNSSPPLAPCDVGTFHRSWDFPRLSYVGAQSVNQAVSNRSVNHRPIVSTTLTVPLDWGVALIILHIWQGFFEFFQGTFTVLKFFVKRKNSCFSPLHIFVSLLPTKPTIDSRWIWY